MKCLRELGVFIERIEHLLRERIRLELNDDADIPSRFITNISDGDLATLIKTGRPNSDPANTTGIDMPSKDGNPALNDEKIDPLVPYIRSLR